MVREMRIGYLSARVLAGRLGRIYPVGEVTTRGYKTKVEGKGCKG